jgi:hypothetical protein
MKKSGHALIARAQPTTATPVGKQHEAVRPRRNVKNTVKWHAIGADLHFADLSFERVH